MRFKTIFIVLFNTLTFTCYGQDKKDCLSLHEGKFVYKEVKGAYSIREQDKQTSYYPNGMINEFSIKWLSECEFSMTFIKSSDKTQKTYLAGDQMKVVINRIDGDCYQFVAYFKGKEFPPTYMCKVKE